MTKHFAHKIDLNGFLLEDEFWEDNEVLEVVGQPHLTEEIEAKEAFPGVPAVLDLGDGTGIEIYTKEGLKVWQELPRDAVEYKPQEQQRNKDGSLAWEVEPVSYKAPDPTPPDIIRTSVPAGLDWPKWDGFKWVEGTPEAELRMKRNAILLVKRSEEIRLELDRQARDKGYDNILTAISYSNDPNPAFREEGLYFLNLRSSMWTELKNEIKLE